ncbi:MAG: hypothetical protein A2Y12_00025 [Planctomycetes bacterium GWF2_42_9]|nr:MAG: hypothetical protein A2Y12_00025 [Planctomycetes bacterium GWF2_42_9]
MAVVAEKRNVRIVDISRKVGVSTATVSYVLNGKHVDAKIPQKTADHILQTAKKMGYRPNYWAKSLAMQKSKMVGLIVPDLGFSVADQLLKGIQRVFDGAGYQVLLAAYHWDREREAREVELMLEKQVDCIIALPFAGSAKIYEDAVTHGCRVIFVCDYLRDVDIASVVLDSDVSVCKALKHLHGLGHERIHLLSVDYNAAVFQDREDVFRREISKLGLSFDDTNISRTILGDVSSIHEQVRSLVSQRNRPTALFCICDALALESLSELAMLGVKVPDELAVVGLGNTAMAENVFFSLTTVDERVEEIGRCAAELALRKDDAFGPIERLLVQGDLYVRGSTVKANKGRKL